MFLELTFGERFAVTSRAAVVVLAVDASAAADAAAARYSVWARVGALIGGGLCME